MGKRQANEDCQGCLVGSLHAELKVIYRACQSAVIARQNTGRDSAFSVF